MDLKVSDDVEQILILAFINVSSLRYIKTRMLFKDYKQNSIGNFMLVVMNLVVFNGCLRSKGVV